MSIYLEIREFSIIIRGGIGQKYQVYENCEKSKLHLTRGFAEINLVEGVGSMKIYFIEPEWYIKNSVFCFTFFFTLSRYFAALCYKIKIKCMVPGQGFHPIQ